MNKEYIYNLLETVKDPEVPVLSIVDLGVVRAVRIKSDIIEIDITPTYSGCPAMDTIREDIEDALKKEGITNFEIKDVLSPAWTTDWISENGLKKLEEYGIAPPKKKSASKLSILGDEQEIRCPKCKSYHTEVVSQFGSTACKALYKCNDCLEPFDYFKCL